MHKGGKMAVASTVALESRDDLSMAYTPGVARVCEAIAEQPELVNDYTWVANTVAVVTDGSAVLGLGDIGAAAADYARNRGTARTEFGEDASAKHP